MADTAGVVNEGGHSEDAAFAELIASSSPEVQQLAHAVRDLVFDVLPQAIEVVWPRQRSVGWGTGPKKFTEQYAYLMPFKQHVTVGFYHGGELPDPTGLLPPTGNTQVSGTLSMRSLRITSLEEVSRPALRSLMQAATRHRVPPPRG